MKVQKMIMDIEELSKDLKKICLQQDQILDEMNQMKADVEELKQFTKYHPEKQHRHSWKHKAEEKGRTSKVEKKKKPFPEELWGKLIKDVTTDDPFNFSDIQELKTLCTPAIKCCRTKQPGQSVHLGLLQQT